MRDMRYDTQTLGGSRQRRDSFDLRNDSEHMSVSNSQSNLDGQNLFDEFGPICVTNDILYFGPSVPHLKYHAVTPPSTWAGATRSLLPKEYMLNLQRDIRLDMSTQTLSVIDDQSNGKWDFEMPVSEFSIHVEPPMGGGVMNLYVKGSTKEEWMEFTFDTAQMAAQFQIDLLANQVLGKVVYSLYHALCLVYEGSECHDGQEFVLHDQEVVAAEKAEQKPDEDNTPVPAVSTGVAWDDAMRALGGIPSVRIALEQLWIFQSKSKRGGKGSRNKPLAAAALPANKVAMAIPKATSDDLLTEPYKGRRLLLGPIDFFRLFVPNLPETALPDSEAHKERMEQLLRWRRKVARAAVLVNAYHKARCIANRGWNLPASAGVGRQLLKKRLAYDDNAENSKHDIHAENEYYEATVSRDVRCLVRPGNKCLHDERNGGGIFLSEHMHAECVSSPIQAYTLVGTHCFMLPEDMAPCHGLHRCRDPVEAIPSLRALIASNPDVHFWVTKHISSVRHCSFIDVYARSLPQGVDTSFDNVMRRYCEGGHKVRDRKLYMMMQLGRTVTQSFISWFVIRLLMYLFSFTQNRRESPRMPRATQSRNPFPAIHITDLCDTLHFGGALQTDESLPTNYVGATIVYQTGVIQSFITRLLFNKLENGAMEKHIMDFTWIIEGEQDDELPERALCTSRVVHINMTEVALPADTSAVVNGNYAIESEKQNEGRETRRQTLFAQAISDVVSRFGKQNESGKGGLDPVLEEKPDGSDDDSASASFEDALRYVDSADPFEIAANKLTEVLEDVRFVPDRIAKSSSAADGVSVASPRSNLPSSCTVLDKLSRDDMKRYFIACRCNLKEAATRLVKSVAWREATFPIDPRRCRLELQNGQFFQQGLDKDGNLVFYFRNMCLGPWRENVDAVILSVLLRLERAIEQRAMTEPNIKCTLIVFMGMPYKDKKKPKGKKGKADDKQSATADKSETAGGDSSKNDGDGDGDASEVDINTTASSQEGAGTADASKPKSVGLSNPRIQQAESWHSHTNRELVTRLLGILEEHYPERLAAAYVVPGRGKHSYYDAVFAGRSKLSKFFRSVTMDKIHFLKNDISKLEDAVPRKILLKMVGGDADIDPSAFSASS